MCASNFPARIAAPVVTGSPVAALPAVLAALGAAVTIAASGGGAVTAAAPVVASSLGRAATVGPIAVTAVAVVGS